MFILASLNYQQPSFSEEMALSVEASLAADILGSQRNLMWGLQELKDRWRGVAGPVSRRYFGMRYHLSPI